MTAASLIRYPFSTTLSLIQFQRDQWEKPSPKFDEQIHKITLLACSLFAILFTVFLDLLLFPVVCLFYPPLLDAAPMKDLPTSPPPPAIPDKQLCTPEQRKKLLSHPYSVNHANFFKSAFKAAFDLLGPEKVKKFKSWVSAGGLAADGEEHPPKDIFSWSAGIFLVYFLRAAKLPVPEAFFVFDSNPKLNEELQHLVKENTALPPDHRVAIYMQLIDPWNKYQLASEMAESFLNKLNAKALEITQTQEFNQKMMAPEI